MTTPSSPQLSFSTRYSLDANIFIAAWRDYYPIDLYPGFWECLQRFGQERRLLSVDRVRDEINSPNELVAWLKRHWRDAFALTTEPHTASVFSQMQIWVQTNDQFLPAAKHEFAGAADGWLAAYAKVLERVKATGKHLGRRKGVSRKRAEEIQSMRQRDGLSWGRIATITGLHSGNIRRICTWDLEEIAPTTFLEG